MDKNNKINTYIFPNGFRIIHQQPTNSLKMTSINVFCDVGSVYEKDGIRGVSHFVEHLCFKGTQNIPNPRDIFQTFDKIGALFNAYTEKRYTCYTIKCEDIYVENCTNILSDMLLNSTFPKADFYKEQKVVFEENNRNENDAENILSEKIDAIIYKGSSYEYPIDTLEYHMDKKSKKYDPKKDISYKNTLNWYHSFYIPSNLVYSIVSNISFKTIQSIIEKSIFIKPKLSNNIYLRQMNLSLEPKLKQIRIHSYIKKGVSTDIINFSFQTCSRLSKDRYCLKILKHVLNGMSGRLFNILREKNGLTYSADCYTEYYEYSGNFMLNTETSPENTMTKNGVMSLLFQLCSDLKKNGITEQEFLVAKGNIRGNYILKTEIGDTIASYNGKHYLLNSDLYTSTNNIVIYQDVYKEYIEPITLNEINIVIKRYFVIENMIIGIIGENPPNENKIYKISRDFNI
jgi:predicted Zn-dependent peptidase